MKTQNTFQKNIGIIIGILVMIGVGTVTLFAEMGSSTTPPAADVSTSSSVPSETTQGVSPAPSTPRAPVVPPVSQTQPAEVPKQTASVYKDGTYSATGSYGSPGGEDQVAVTLTLTDDIITDVTVTPSAQDGTSRRYQSRFVSGYKQYVLGKNIASVNLTSVSGSSLTPIGFDNALAQIKAQAKA